MSNQNNRRTARTLARLRSTGAVQEQSQAWSYLQPVCKPQRRSSRLASTVLCWAAALGTLTVGAQNLGKGEEGRAAVGQCYAACMDKAFQSASTTQEKSTRLTELMISDDFFLLTNDSQDEFIRLYRLDVCLLAQNHVRGIDACYAGCVDVERAYGVGSTNARSRFHRLLRDDRQALQDVGLWRDYRTFPVFGSGEFEDACDRLYDNAAVVTDAQASPGARTLFVGQPPDPHRATAGTQTPRQSGAREGRRYRLSQMGRRTAPLTRATTSVAPTTPARRPSRTGRAYDPRQTEPRASPPPRSSPGYRRGGLSRCARRCRRR